MHEHTVTQRWRHPALLIFLLGGFLGAALNLGATFLLVREFSVPALAAFFIGTFLNQAFHYVYYNVVYVNHEIRLKTSLPVHLFLSLWVSAGSAALLGAFLAAFHWPLPGALAACLLVLAFSNALLNRISTFSSAKMAEVEYREMNESYYDDYTDGSKFSKFRVWYHRSRYERLTRFVSEYFKKGMRMADLGCGNAWWNIRGLPVTGVDINAKMLGWAKKHGRLKDFKVCADLAKTGLKAKSFDVVLMSEVLEHVFDHKGVLADVRRILKPRGTFLITVPYDFFMGPFFILFNLNCLYMGYVRGSEYHKYRCGHIHHFTKNRLRRTLAENGFLLERVFVVNGLLLYASARIRPSQRG
jgi:ubiquinone/menaquinone biosynthesis C-methylase UbiE/putative flippase GtrA